jgi:hypothetical protein
MAAATTTTATTANWDAFYKQPGIADYDWSAVKFPTEEKLPRDNSTPSTPLFEYDQRHGDNVTSAYSQVLANSTVQAFGLITDQNNTVLNKLLEPSTCINGLLGGQTENFKLKAYAAEYLATEGVQDALTKVILGTCVDADGGKAQMFVIYNQEWFTTWLKNLVGRVFRAVIAQTSLALVAKRLTNGIKANTSPIDDFLEIGDLKWAWFNATLEDARLVIGVPVAYQDVPPLHRGGNSASDSSSESRLNSENDSVDDKKAAKKAPMSSKPSAKKKKRVRVDDDDAFM